MNSFITLLISLIVINLQAKSYECVTGILDPKLTKSETTEIFEGLPQLLNPVKKNNFTIFTDNNLFNPKITLTIDSRTNEITVSQFSYYEDLIDIKAGFDPKGKFRLSIKNKTILCNMY